MLAATVGVAFGQASDITAEAADAVLLEPSLAKVDELIHISRHMRRIALESALGGMGLSMIGMIAAAAGYLAARGWRGHAGADRSGGGAERAARRVAARGKNRLLKSGCILQQIAY